VFGADAPQIFKPWIESGAELVTSITEDKTKNIDGHDDAVCRPTSSKIFCDYHGDGVTRARFHCITCDAKFCAECDNVRHLHPTRANHFRQLLPIVSPSSVGASAAAESPDSCSAISDEMKVSAAIGSLFNTENHIEQVNKPKEIKFSDGCVSCQARGLRLIVDIAKLHVHIDMKREAALNNSNLLAQSSFCRFCGGDLNNHGASKFNSNSFGHNVCSDEDCQEKLQRVCTKRLPCGHQCIGCRDEQTCLPCVYGCQPDYGINAHDKCRICSAEDLCEGPCVQLECGHVFHYSCIEEKLKYRWELQGPRISFAFLNCPLCRQQMKSPVISDLMDPLLKIKEKVEKMVLLRLEYENLANHDALKKGGAFYGDQIGFGMHTFAYYECSKCSNPYYGGRHECEDDLEAEGGQRRKWDRNELVCPRCLPFATKSECHIHGSDFIEYKCRFCCSVAVYFCFGTTHFCQKCHETPSKLTNCAIKDLPKCPAGPQLKQLKGKCPLGIDHPPTGEEFALGCGICRQTQSF
jgi:E3 ubiquitin-protein ligase MYCBP2